MQCCSWADNWWVGQVEGGWLFIMVKVSCYCCAVNVSQRSWCFTSLHVFPMWMSRFVWMAKFVWHSLQDKNIKCENSKWSCINCKMSRIPKLQKYKGHLRTKRTEVIKGPRLEKDQRCKGHQYSSLLRYFLRLGFIPRFAIYENYGATQ